MEVKVLNRLLAAAELRNPKVFNASRERYVAEISFKAGFKEALDTVVATRQYDEGKQAGMKEVVECGLITVTSFSKWQAKLKEWGLVAHNK